MYDRSHYQEKSSAPEIKGATNLQMYYSDGLKILTLDFTIFRCGIFNSIILIVLCSVNHLKSGRVYQGYSSLEKSFKMAARSSAKPELKVNSADFEVGENDQIISGKQWLLI